MPKVLKVLYEIDAAGCWIWKGRPHSDKGYGRIKVRGGERKLAHRFIYERHRGPIPAGMCLLHRCDVAMCVNPDHMFIGTTADNNADRARKGRSARGERGSNTKLTAAQVLEIRAEPHTACIRQRLAEKFGVSIHTIADLRCKKTNWSHLL